MTIYILKSEQESARERRCFGIENKVNALRLMRGLEVAHQHMQLREYVKQHAYSQFLVRLERLGQQDNSAAETHRD